MVRTYVRKRKGERITGSAIIGGKRANLWKAIGGKQSAAGEGAKLAEGMAKRIAKDTQRALPGHIWRKIPNGQGGYTTRCVVCRARK